MGEGFCIDFPAGTVFKGNYSSDLSDSSITKTAIDFTEVEGDNGYNIQIPLDYEVELAVKEPEKKPIYDTFTITNTLFTHATGAADQPRDVTTNVDDITDNFSIDYDTTTDDLEITIFISATNDIHNHEVYEAEGVAIFDYLQTQEAYLNMLLDQKPTTQTYIDIRVDEVHVGDGIDLVFKLEDGVSEALMLQTSVDIENFDEDTHTPKNDENHRVLFPRLDQKVSSTDSILRQVDVLSDTAITSDGVIDEWDTRHETDFDNIKTNADTAAVEAKKAKIAALV